MCQTFLENPLYYCSTSSDMKYVWTLYFNLTLEYLDISNSPIKKNWSMTLLEYQDYLIVERILRVA